MKKLFSKLLKKRSRRGFSMAEVVVAIAVIVIVSGSAITYIGAQTRAEAKAVASIEATNISENAIECFRYAGANDKDFVGWFNLCGYNVSGDGPYTVTKNGATVKITIVGDTITIVATSGGDEILTTSYTR